MAGRGRSLTLPAWMTGDTGGKTPPPHDAAHVNVAVLRSERGKSRSRSADRLGGSGRRNPRSRSRSRDRESSPRYSDRSRGDRDRDRDRDRRSSYTSSGGHGGSDISRRGSGRDRDRSASPEEAARKWVSRIKNRKSNFDVRPPDGVVLPQIGGLGTSLNPALAVHGSNGVLQSGMTNDAANMQQTKHARRGIGNNCTERDIESFIRDVIFKAMAPAKPSGDPVLNTYVNSDKCFCFMELNSIELTTACCSLDGISYKGNTLKIRRPNDFRPEAMPAGLPPPPIFNLAALGIVGTTVSEGPGKVFVGGLPYHLTEEEIKELLGAFGPLRSFHLVKDTGAMNSKGYAFCEYADMENTTLAIQGLNGLQVGDKTLTVRIAAQSGGHPPPPPPAAASFAYNPVSNNISNGLIFNPYAQQQQHPPPPPPGAPPLANITADPLINKSPTKVLMLKNMLDPEELDDDDEFGEICEDVKDECAQHGAVLSVLIPRVKENFPKQCEGSVFVEFERAENAQKAALALSGRKFADRIVDVDYFDEIKFSNRILQ